MKKELLVLLMIVSSVLLLTAEGKQDDDVQFYGRGPGMMGGYRFSDDEDDSTYLDSLEMITVSGSLSLINGELPFIESEGTKYTIRAPWAYMDELELANGMAVTVEGYLMPGPSLQWDDSEKNLMAIKAVVNGEEIEIDHPMNGYARCGTGPMGRRSGFNGSRGGRGSRGGARMGGPRFQ